MCDSGHLGEFGKHVSSTPLLSILLLTNVARCIQNLCLCQERFDALKKPVDYFTPEGKHFVDEFCTLIKSYNRIEKMVTASHVCLTLITYFLTLLISQTTTAKAMAAYRPEPRGLRLSPHDKMDSQTMFRRDGAIAQGGSC